MRQKLGSTVNIVPAFAAIIVHLGKMTMQSVKIVYCDYREMTEFEFIYIP
jgi:hypothetical protein